MHLGEWHGVEFNSDRFSAWCKLFCECADVYLQLIKINYDHWSVIRSFKFETLAKIGKTFCHTCHNEDAFDRWFLPSKNCFIAQNEIARERFTLKNTDEISFYRYICQNCGNSTTVNTNETRLRVVYCFSDDNLPSGSSITDYARLVRGTKDPYCEWYAVQVVGKDIITPLLVHLGT